MAKKDIIRTGQINSLYFVKFPFRSDLNFFSFDLDEMRKEGLLDKEQKEIRR